MWNVSQTFVCVKMALFLDSSGVTQSSRVCLCIPKFTSHVWSLELWQINGTVSAGSMSFTYQTHTHIILEHMPVEKTGAQVRNDGGKTAQMRDEEVRYHWGHDLKRLIRLDISVILQHDTLIPMNNWTIHFKPATFIHQLFNRITRVIFMLCSAAFLRIWLHRSSLAGWGSGLDQNLSR